MPKLYLVSVTWDVVIEADDAKQAEKKVKGKIPGMMKNIGVTSGFLVERVKEIAKL